VIGSRHQGIDQNNVAVNDRRQSCRVDQGGESIDNATNISRKLDRSDRRIVQGWFKSTNSLQRGKEQSVDVEASATSNRHKSKRQEVTYHRIKADHLIVPSNKSKLLRLVIQQEQVVATCYLLVTSRSKFYSKSKSQQLEGTILRGLVFKFGFDFHPTSLEPWLLLLHLSPWTPTLKSP
jgi:hypothetical protein